MDDISAWLSSHDVSISVIGIGERGCRIVQSLETEAPIRTRTATDADDTTSILDSVTGDTFCLLTGNLDEPGVADRFAAILPSAGPFTIVLPEGSASGVRPIAEHADWLLPIKTGGDDHEWLEQTILDLCESVLPPTGCELGWGDLVSGFPDQVGYVSVIPLGEASTGSTVELFATRELPDLDSILYFFCTPERPDHRAVESAMSSLDHPTVRAFLWDYRVHPRYAETPHVKQILSSEVDTETRIRLLQH